MGRLGASCGEKFSKNAVLGRLGDVLGASWGCVGASWVRLERLGRESLIFQWFWEVLGGDATHVPWRAGRIADPLNLKENTKLRRNKGKVVGEG